MPIFVVLIVFSGVFYLFYKVKFYRTKKSMERQWLSAKSSIALGSFIFFFGINQLFIYRSNVSLIIGAVFIIVGLTSAWAGYRAYKHFLPLAIQEAEES
ncbi:YtpI family protein [Metabacillus arenae]|uniref:YtpI family protein n=1 Tax=Metabacillus arenae TaxID=2771434 RepID=A0A926N9Q2_9BACI|nr:YtpI family protein [Metabacillus arenae]MBD1380107.1 YtpI family protein [Metabacillus arenae]